MKKNTRLVCLALAGLFILILLFTVVLSAVSYAAGKSTRSETVYVDLDHDGTPISILSSVYLSNPEKLDTLTDNSILTDLRNVMGSEAPTVEGTLSTWKAEGEDVSYQGKSEKQLPFTISIRYFLDGKEMDAEDMGGKSGRVRIEVNIENLDAHEVEVEGETITMYTPFTVIGIFTLDESFSSVTAEDAKVSNDAGSIMVMGTILPGLAKSLGIEAKGKLSECFSFEANVREFELSEVMFIAMNGIVDASDLSGVDDVQSLLDGFDDLQAGMNKLERGARQLRNGAEEYKEGVGTYVSGVGELAEGAGSLKAGLDSLSQGMNQMGGVGSLASGLTEAANGLSSMKEQLQGALNGSAITEAQVAAILAAANAAMDPPLTEGQMAVLQAVLMSSLNSGGQNIDLSQLDTLIASLNSMAAGVSGLSGGLSQMQAGVSKLAEGAGSLKEGADTLAENGSSLVKGAEELYSGAASLGHGIRTLNQEGISKMIEETSDVNVSLSRKNALLDLSDQYTSFSGLDSDENMGSVKFVLNTEDIFTPKPLPLPETDVEPSLPADTQVKEGFTLEQKIYVAVGALVVAAIVVTLVLRGRKKHKSS